MLVETADGTSLFDMGGLFDDLKCALRKSVDLVDFGAKDYDNDDEFWEALYDVDTVIGGGTIHSLPSQHSPKLCYCPYCLY